MPDKKQTMTLKRPTSSKKAQAAEDFVNEAGNETQTTAPVEGELEWEAEGINPNVIKPFNLRLNQPDSLKVKFIVKNSPQFKSKHDFCMQVVQDAIEAELDKLLKK